MSTIRFCEVRDCKNIHVAHGLCDKHRQRLKKHGHLKQARPEDWGQKEKHPLMGTYRWMKKMEAKFSICKEWKDFWKFVEDVGNRPSEKHQLRRIDRHGNYSPENCKWVKIEPNKNKADYAKQWRKNNPDKVKNNELRKKFGITLEDYNKMYEEQNGCCKICNSSYSKEKQALSVDHCHITGKVRGLLCNTCNRALGMFKDSQEILESAAKYLKVNN